MNTRNFAFILRAAMRTALALGGVLLSSGQTLINLGTQGRNADFTGQPYTRPMRTGTSLPATCTVGDMFFDIAAAAGKNFYACTATNTWTLESASGSGSSSGLADPGSNGVVVRTAPNTTTAVPAPQGTIVGTSDTQTLTNKSIDASEINTGVFSASQMPPFSGDFTTSRGSTLATLASVNGNAGTFGDSSHSVQVTVDTKGRITSISQFAISGSSIGYPGAGIPCSTGSAWCASFTAPSSPIVGISDTQTLTNKTIDASEIKTGVFSATQIPAFSGDFTTPGGSTVATLASVNENPGTYGDSSHSVQLTVDAKGRITAVAQVAISGTGGSGGSTGMTSGSLSALPLTCATGDLYFATDQPAGQQIYTCSATDVWTQVVSLGSSGALAFTNGSLDIVTSVVPRLMAANVFTGSNTFSSKTMFSQIATGNANNTDLAGQLTLAAGSASYTFSGQYTSAPVCTASDTTAQNAVKVSTTPTTLTLAGTGSDLINYICVGRN